MKRSYLVAAAGVAGLALAAAAVLLWRPGAEPATAPAPSPTPTRTQPTPTQPDEPEPDGDPGAATPGPTEPAATPTPAAPATPSSPAPLHPAVTPDPTASPPLDAAPLEGRARLTDPPGDVVDSAGEPASPPAPAADLVAVELAGDGAALAVTFEVEGEVPEPGRALLWSLDVWVGEEQAYTVTVQQDGARLLAAVVDWETGEQTALEDVAAAGSEVTVSVPAAELPGVDGPFRWQALGQADGGYEDTAPDTTLAWFPLPD